MHARRAAILCGVMALVACGGPSATPSQHGATPDAAATLSPAKSATPALEPTASPVARAVEADSLVETVVEGLTVREQPGLSAAEVGVAPPGLRAWVLDGPVEADGHRWFLLTGAPLDTGDPSACLEAASADVACPAWTGWAAGGPPGKDAWLRTVAVACPPTRDLDAYLSLTPEERLLCAGNDEWELAVYLPPLEGGRGCLPVWVTDPGWMTGECTFVFPQPVERRLDEDTSLQMFTPPEVNTCGQPGVCWWNAYKGEWVVVTGHLDDPVARTCRAVLAEGLDEGSVGSPPAPELVVHRCRLHFVVVAVGEADRGG